MLKDLFFTTSKLILLIDLPVSLVLINFICIVLNVISAGARLPLFCEVLKQVDGIGLEQKLC